MRKKRSSRGKSVPQKKGKVWWTQMRRKRKRYTLPSKGTLPVSTTILGKDTWLH
jgi:hypothetical protein